MKYAAVHLAWLRQRPALAATNEELGAWLRLDALTSGLETGEGEAALGEGRITDAASWSDREWGSVLLTRGDVDLVVEAGLARWDDDDLLVDGYDLAGQRAVQAKRANARKPPREGSRPRGRPKKAGEKAAAKAGEKAAAKAGEKAPPTSPVPTSPVLASPAPSPMAAAAEARMDLIRGGYRRRYVAAHGAPPAEGEAAAKHMSSLVRWTREAELTDPQCETLLDHFFDSPWAAEVTHFVGRLAQFPIEFRRGPLDSHPGRAQARTAGGDELEQARERRRLEDELDALEQQQADGLPGLGGQIRETRRRIAALGGRGHQSDAEATRYASTDWGEVADNEDEWRKVLGA